MWVCITQRRKEGFLFFFFQQVEERHRCYKLVWEGKKNIKIMTNEANK